MRNAKMMKTAKTLDLITSVIQKILIVATLLVMALGFVMVILGEEFFVNSLITVDVGHLTLILDDTDMTIVDIVMKYGVVVIVEMILFLLLIFYGIKIIRRILNPMKNGKPFEVSVAKNIKKLGCLLLISGAVNIIFQFIEKAILLNAYDFSVLFNTENVRAFEINNNVDITFIIFACVLFLLSYVFQYGEELQRDSDETL